MTQPTLFGAPPEPIRLGPRQLRALELIDQAGYEGVTADEVGADIHAARGKHNVDTRCDWCAKEGRGVLQSLRAHDLVTRRQGGGWTRRDRPAREQQTDVYDPSTAPFPEGF